MATHSLQLLLLIASAPYLAPGAADRGLACPSGCQCAWHEHKCDDALLGAVPAGHDWSYVTTLFLSGNNITTLPPDAFAPYPSLSTLVLSDNELTKLDLGVFASTRWLGELRAARNQIAALQPAASPGKLGALEKLDLSYNLLTALDPHVFDAATELLYLNLDGNPLLLPSDRPLLVHPTVASLSMAHVYAKALAPLTLSALPNLNTLTLTASEVRNISWALTQAPSLYSVELQDNEIQELPANSFMVGIRLGQLNLKGNPLEKIEQAALSVLRKGTIFSIEDTKLACNCAYKNIWMWSIEQGVKLNAKCTSEPPCNFRKRMHINHVH